MGEQLRPMGTVMPVRSRPTSAATAETAASVEERTLLQHRGEVGQVTGGGGVPVAAARVYNEGIN
jgi:hypothetical protein